MHGSDHGHGGDHSFDHAGGGYYGGHHFAGGGDHGGVHVGGHTTHDLSLAHASDIIGHAGGIAVEGVVFMAVLDWATGHHNSGFHYSFSNHNVNVHFDRPYHIDGTGLGGYPKRRVMPNTPRPVDINQMKMQPDSRIFIVHAHNIGLPDLDLLFSIWPERFGFVEITDRPGASGLKETKVGQCLSWDWTHPTDGPLPPGALPGVIVNTKRRKRVFQLGKPSPRLSLWRKLQLSLGVGPAPRRGELVADPHSNCVVESYDLEWDYAQTGTAEVKIELRVKPNLRWYPSAFNSRQKQWLPGYWDVVREPYEAHRRAALALAKCLHHELSEFKRVPGKLEAYLEALRKLPGYTPPSNLPDGVTRGTTEDERELEEYEVEQERNQDRRSDSQLPTTTPTTPTTPVTPAPTVDGLPPTPDQDTGSAVDGLPGYTEYAPAAPAASSASSGLAPSAPGTVTADLELPAKAPLPYSQNTVNGHPLDTVGDDGAVEVHVGLGDFKDYKGHHA